MDKKITLTELMKFIKLAEVLYPNAEVASFGTSFQNGKYYHAIFLKYEGKEIVYKIPCYLEDVDK